MLFFAENIFEYKYCISLTEGIQESCGNELATNSQNRHFKICEKMTNLLTFNSIYSLIGEMFPSRLSNILKIPEEFLAYERSRFFSHFQRF